MKKKQNNFITHKLSTFLCWDMSATFCCQFINEIKSLNLISVLERESRDKIIEDISVDIEIYFECSST